ncbi:MAG: discoidin domain-containing protein, partial [Thermoguttaceae bacterium]
MRKIIYVLLLLSALGAATHASEHDTIIGYKQAVLDDWMTQAKLRYNDNGASAISVITCEEDANGAVDGVIDGKWGFHTENEPNPWWQIDFEQPVEICKIRLYNRCDHCGERNRHLIAQISDDGKNWTNFWQNDGTMFYGATDSAPLEITFPLTGVTLSQKKNDAADSKSVTAGTQPVKGRFMRLTIDGTSYLHLDEVEVYAKDNPDVNIALGKPATQSSTSQWSTKPVTLDSENNYDSLITNEILAKVLKSGRLLAADLRLKGVDTAAAEPVFNEVAIFLASSDTKLTKAESDADTKFALYVKLRGAIRELALSNPLINFDSIVFAKHAPGIFPHVSDQYYCWWQRGNGAICVLQNT